MSQVVPDVPSLAASLRPWLIVGFGPHSHTGVVVAVRGKLDDAGNLTVMDIQPAGVPIPKPLPVVTAGIGCLRVCVPLCLCVCFPVYGFVFAAVVAIEFVD